MIHLDHKRAAGYCLAVLLAASLSARPISFSSADDPALISLLDAIARKIDSFPDLDRWEAVSTTTRTRMDKSWVPEKITRIRKSVRINGQDRQEKILEATETEKGVTRDITEKTARAYDERARKAQEERASRKPPKAGDGGRRTITLTKKDFAPFGPADRPRYAFTRLEDTVLDGIPVYVIETRARVRKPENIEGKYFFTRDTLDILRVALRPSKNPKFVKHVEMEVDFQPLQGSLALKRTRFKIHAGFLFKTVRMVVEEEYDSFRFLPEPPPPDIGEPYSQ